MSARKGWRPSRWRRQFAHVLLAAEIEASVSAFNRLVALAIDHHIAVVAELQTQPHSDRPDRPVLAVQVVAPL